MDLFLTESQAVRKNQFSGEYKTDTVQFNVFGNWLDGIPLNSGDLAAGQRLVVKAVALNSPGYWEFLGRLNPLEVIRMALNDAHERRKDRDYRESVEKERMLLENQIKVTEYYDQALAVLERAVRLSKSLNEVPDHMLRKEILDGLVGPLSALVQAQKNSVISKATIVDVE